MATLASDFYDVPRVVHAVPISVLKKKKKEKKINVLISIENVVYAAPEKKRDREKR